MTKPTMSDTAADDVGQHGIEPHVSLAEAATLLGVAPATLYNHLCAATPAVRALRPVKLLNRWRFPLAAIREAYQRGRWAVTGMTRPAPPAARRRA